MHSKENSFKSGQSFSTCFGRKHLESTRTANETRNKHKFNEKPIKTIINSFRIEPHLSENIKCNRLVSEKSGEEGDEKEKETSDEDTSLLENGEYDCSDEEYEINSICLVDPNSKKILTGSDLNKFYYSISKWFNSLKSTFITSPLHKREELFASKRSYPKNPNLKPSRKSQKSFKLNSTKSVFSDFVSGDLKKDIKLKLKYDNTSDHEWDEAEIRGYLKYRYFMRKRNKFNDSLCIVPGIGNVYMSRMCHIIPNFGTLLELYLSIDENNFKALLYAYAKINSHYLNLIITACRNYLKKYGFDFSDATVFIPKNYRLFEFNLRN